MTLIDWNVAVPAVNVFIPLLTVAPPLPADPMVANIEYKFVVPEKIVPPESVVENKLPAVTVDELKLVAVSVLMIVAPDVYSVLIVNAVTLTDWNVAVPAVKVLIPLLTVVTTGI